LQDEEYVEGIEAGIERAVTKFDEACKPTFKGSGPSYPFKIAGIRDDPQKGFKNECVWLSAYV
jgi:hypothetical protein